MFNPSKNLVIFGRKAVLEALQNSQLVVSKIHLANSNKSAKILDEICTLAKQRNVAIDYKDKLQLSRISKSSKQDQGVAADIQLPTLHHIDELANLSSQKSSANKLLLLDGVTNPQNVGMIIRSVAASGITGLILPRKGCADLGPLVIKASAGTIFNCPIYRCDKAEQALNLVKTIQGKIFSLALGAKTQLGEETSSETLNVYILGNESEGVSKQCLAMSDETVTIPMHNNVESLNVAITAALIAFG